MPRLSARLMETPGAARLQERLQDDLAARNCVILMVPATVPSGVIWTTIHEYLGQTFNIHEVELPQLGYHEPAAELGRYLEARYELAVSPRTLAALVQTPYLPDVLHLSGFENLESAAQLTWLNFVCEWAEYLPSVRSQMGKPTALCLPVPVAYLKVPQPQSKLFLKVRWWWGIPSNLDLHLLCRFEHMGNEEDLLAQWRENLLTSLAGTDLEFAEYLWTRMELKWEDFVAACQEYASQRGWTPECLQHCIGISSWNCNAAVSASQYYPEPGYVESWARGVIYYTPEQGVQLHTAVLATLHKDELLRQRLWQGQVGLVLPLIETFRLNVCQTLTDTYGEGWPTRWQVPLTEWECTAAVQSPGQCELGHLKTLLQRPELHAQRRFLSAVHPATWMRNQIAHGTPILYNEYVRLHTLIAQLCFD